MNARKPVGRAIYAKWKRLKTEVEQCAFDACESNGAARPKRHLNAALNELQVVRKIRLGGDALAGHADFPHPIWCRNAIDEEDPKIRTSG